ncbi:PRD domain-containing protein [Streptomyces sp. NPDC047000]|uniref:PRD domain-containing protein n=1 Tax=Streptomyces sp. NPDC047000 TaxID=3155474 RepID=UPI00340E9EDC
MRVKQVLNNSVVLGIDDSGIEVVLLGPGIGFRAAVGDRIDPSTVQRTFVPEGIGSVERLAAMVEEISIDAVTAAEEVVRLGRERLGRHVTYRVLIPLADHLGVALQRARQGAAIEYPLRSELSYLYPAELEFARQAVELLRQRTGVDLPAGEAVPIAMHFVNAQFGSDDMRDYLRITEALQQILGIIEEEYGLRFDHQSIDVARFVTHLRFLFVRNRRDPVALPEEDATRDPDTLLDTIRSARPRQYASAVRIARLLEGLFGWTVDSDEILYLCLHVARLTDTRRPAPQSPGKQE